MDECHHVPAAAFEYAVRRIPARTWLGLTATPYRRDRLDDLIGLQPGPVRHTVAEPAGAAGALDDMAATGPRAPVPRVVVHRTGYRYERDANPSEPGGIAAIYRDLVADDARKRADRKRRLRLVGDLRQLSGVDAMDPSYGSSG